MPTLGYNVPDALLTVSRALPNGAATVTSGSIDLETTGGNDFIARCEARITAPALTTAQLANAATVTYDLLTSASADLSSPTVLVAGLLVQTGAGGVGAATAQARAKLPTNVKRYVGFRATNSGAGNASTSNGVLELLT
jgi:hypothetical protein